MVPTLVRAYKTRRLLSPFPTVPAVLFTLYHVLSCVGRGIFDSLVPNVYSQVRTYSGVLHTINKTSNLDKPVFSLGGKAKSSEADNVRRTMVQGQMERVFER